MPIVCGTDFSARSAHALSAAAALASRRHDAELWLVHVLDRATTRRLDAVEWDRLKTKTDARLQTEAQRLREQYSLRHVYSLTLVGATSDVLSDFARIKRASLIVVAAQEHEAPELLRVGSTSERVALSSSVPVLVVHDASAFLSWSRGERPLRLLLEVDWTRSSAAALDLVKALRAAGPCDVVVVSDAHQSATNSGRQADDALGSPELLAQALATYVGELSGEGSLEFKALLGDGRLGASVLEAAAAHAADLVVIGTHRQARLRRLGPASVHILHFARASIMCVPAVDAPAQLEPKLTRCVLIATDLSSASNNAVTAGYGLLAERGGEVHLLHVARVERPTHLTQLFAQLRELIPPWAAGRGIATNIEVIESSDPARTIVETAARSDAHVVCLGTHGRSGVGRLLLGSVAERVVRESTRPVLVVPPLPP